MSEEHQHQGKVFMSNNKLVCNECHPADLKGGNECYCDCHNRGSERCPSCKRFHVTAGF